MNPADPLADLRDIHLPDAPPWWPPAPGWWLLAVLLLLVAVLIVRAYLRARALDAPRRAALADLRALRARHEHGESREPEAQQLVAAELSSLLKRYVLTRYPPAQVAGLSGSEWLAFLARGDGAGGFADENARALAHAAYAQGIETDLPALLDLGERWIKLNPSRRFRLRLQSSSRARDPQSVNQTPLAPGQI